MHIVLADDHTLVREILRDFLTTGPLRASVTEAASLPEAVEAAAGAGHVDLILLDLIMPGMNGVAGVLEAVQRFPQVPVAIISGTTRRDDVQGAMKLGARGFILKTMRPNEMIEAIKTVVGGGTFVPAMIDSGTGAISVGTSQPAGTPANEGKALRTLTPREREVLNLLIKGFPNKKIASELTLQEITIRVHLQNVYRKLGVSNRAHAVATALNSGWHDQRPA